MQNLQHDTHLERHGTSVYRVSTEGLPRWVASYHKSGVLYVDLLWPAKFAIKVINTCRYHIKRFILYSLIYLRFLWAYIGRLYTCWRPLNLCHNKYMIKINIKTALYNTWQCYYGRKVSLSLTSSPSLFHLLQINLEKIISNTWLNFIETW